MPSAWHASMAAETGARTKQMKKSVGSEIQAAASPKAPPSRTRIETTPCAYLRVVTRGKEKNSPAGGTQHSAIEPKVGERKPAQQDADHEASRPARRSRCASRDSHERRQRRGRSRGDEDGGVLERDVHDDDELEHALRARLRRPTSTCRARRPPRRRQRLEVSVASQALSNGGDGALGVCARCEFPCFACTMPTRRGFYPLRRSPRREVLAPDLAQPEHHLSFRWVVSNGSV